MMIRPCTDADFHSILDIINDGATAYRGVIPDDRWHDPYMPAQELAAEIAASVAFWGIEREGALRGVMGLQDVRDVCLIRHAYIATAFRRQGLGGQLLGALIARAGKPMLIGTWAAAEWAVAFYEKHGFRLVEADDKARLLNTYWSIPARQVETSVVLADQRWWERAGDASG